MPSRSHGRSNPSGGSREGARASPLFWVKKEEMTEGRKASSGSKTEPAPSLAQSLDPTLNPDVVDSIPTRSKDFFFTSCGSLIPFTLHGLN